jgi:hypothetical protein
MSLDGAKNTRERLMPKIQVSRRSLLKALGTSAALLPFVPMLERESAAAGSPRRLVLVWLANAPVTEQWKPSGSDASFGFGAIAQGMERHKSKAILLGGVHKLPYMHPTGVGTHEHSMGCTSAWTATYQLASQSQADPGSGTDDWADGISVDQYVAQRLQLRTIELGVLTGDSNPANRMIYKAPGQPITPETNPYAFYQANFANAVLSDAERTLLQAEGKSVLDFVRADLSRVRARVGRQDQAKMDAHLEALRSVERKLTDAPSACKTVDLGAPVDTGSGDNLPKVLDLQTELLALALSCDVARIASLQILGSVPGLVPSWLGIPYGYHAIGHDINGPAPSGAGLSGPEARDYIQKIDTWFYNAHAALIDKLETYGVMDNTLVVFDREMSYSGHSQFNMPYLLVEGPGGYFRTGRYLEYGDGSFSPSRDNNPGVPHAKLLVSICNSMGLEDVQVFGDPQYGTGALPNLKA